MSIDRAIRGARTAALYPFALGGLPVFALTGNTPHLAYAAMRRLYCLTDGRSNRWLSRLLEAPRGVRGNAPVEGVLGKLDASAIADATASIEAHGYHIFDVKLPADVVASLTKAAFREPATLLPAPRAGDRRAVYDPGAPPRSIKYDFDEAFICSLPEVHRLLMDDSLLAVAERYLDCTPVNDLLAMWWSTSFPAPPNSEVAQLFHFDMDRLKFLKFFFYLTDVEADTGPHCYVEGSHREKPLSVRSDGRKSDGAIEAAYGAARIKEITGRAGTIIAADTSGFHKGKPLVRGDRLLLQIEFTNCFFGQRYRRLRLDDQASAELRAFVAKHPHTFQRFTVP